MTGLGLELAALARRPDVIVGCRDAAPLSGLAPELAPFVRRPFMERIDPRLRAPQARSLIFAGLGYGKRAVLAPDGAPRGRIAQSFLGPDYHGVMKALLEGLAQRMLAHRAFWYEVHADTGPLMERAFAQQAGLGVLGANRCLISEKLGSWFHLGYMVTDIPPEALEGAEAAPLAEAASPAGSASQAGSAPQAGSASRAGSAGGPARFCEHCGRCREACPGGALTPEGFDYTRCVSYLTQRPGALTPDQRRSMGLWVVGCDICQAVCPRNKGKQPGAPAPIDEARPLLADLMALTPEAFEARFRHTAAGWRGVKILRRNGAVALENWWTYSGF